MAFGLASQLGVALFEDTDPIQLWPGRSDEEAATVETKYHSGIIDASGYAADQKTRRKPRALDMGISR